MRHAGSGNLGELVEFLDQAAMNVFELDVRSRKNRLGEAPFLLEQGEQEMLDVNLLVPAAAASDWAARNPSWSFSVKRLKSITCRPLEETIAC